MNLFAKRRTYTSLIIFEEKIQALRLDKKKEKVLGLAEAKLQPGIVVAGEVKDHSKLAQSIISLFQSAKFTDKYVVIGIPENKSYTKVLTLPKLKAEELTEAVTWEAETYLPIAIDQVYMDWKIIGESKKNEVNILLIAVPKEIIDGYTQSLQQVGLIPIAYETTALSLVRLIENQGIRAMIVDVRSQHAVITLTRGRAIEASSIVSISGQDQTKEMQNIIQTINKMLAFYEEKQSEEEKIKTIFISGESLTQGLLTEIANGTQKEVKPCPIPVKNLPSQQALNFALVSSLAMKEIASPDDEDTINLLPPQIQKQFDNLQKKRTTKTWLALSTVIIMLSLLASIATLLFFQNIQTSLANEKLSIPTLPPEAGIAVKKTNELNNQAKTIDDVGSKRIFPQQRLANIVPLITNEIQLININIDETQSKIRIVGRAKKRNDLLKFRDDIENLDEIKDAILPLSSLEKAENIDFVLTATLIKNT